MLVRSKTSLESLVKFIEKANQKCLFLTGAGISTDSGIPDYRGTEGVYSRNPEFKPIQYQQFIGFHTYRQRYWARSFLGWPKISSSKSNMNHAALARLQQLGLSDALITQNVDGLHRASNPLELHGTLHKVHCTSCGEITTRHEMQSKLNHLNPDLAHYLEHNPVQNADVASSNPDGDAEALFNYDEFKYPPCSNCGGIIKPSVVFFGENISTLDKEKSFKLVSECTAIVAIATSLQVYSAFRLIKMAKEQGVPVAILTIGVSRGDQLADLRIDEPCNPLLTQVVEYFDK